MNLLNSIKVNTTGDSDFWLDKQQACLVLVGPDKNVKTLQLDDYGWGLVEDVESAFIKVEPYCSNLSNLLIVSENSIDVVVRETLKDRRTIYVAETKMLDAVASDDFVLILRADGKLNLYDKMTNEIKDIDLESAPKITKIKSEGLSYNAFFALSENGTLYKLEVETHESSRNLVEAIIMRGSNSAHQPAKQSVVLVDKDNVYFYSNEEFFAKIPKNDIGSLQLLKSFGELPLSNIIGIFLIATSRILVQYTTELVIFDTESNSVVLRAEAEGKISQAVIWQNKLLTLDDCGILNNFSLPEVEIPKPPAKKPRFLIEEEEEEQIEKTPVREVHETAHHIAIINENDDVNHDKMIDDFLATGMFDIENKIKESNLTENKEVVSAKEIAENNTKETTPEAEVQKPQMAQDHNYQEEEVQKPKKPIKDSNIRLFEHVERLPQPTFSVGGSQSYGGRRIIRANHIGMITLHENPDINSIEVEFSDSSLHKKMIIDNKDHFELGDLSEKGIVLASCGQIQNIDEYEDESVEARSRSEPRLYFKAINADHQWTIKFGSDQNIEFVSVSSLFVSVFCSNNLLRIYDFGGTELLNFTLDRSLVSICSFEHFVAVVFHSGLPLHGIQALQTRVYNIRDLTVEFEVPLAITPYAKLQWVGFSDDGILYTQDTDDTIRSLFNRSFWVPVYENENKNKFWLLGILDSELIGYRLASGEKTPNPTLRYHSMQVARRALISHTPLGLANEQQSLMFSAIDLEHDREKYNNFKHIKETITSDRYRNIFRNKICNQEDLYQRFQNAEMQKVEYIRKLLVDDKQMAAVSYALQIRSESHFQIVVSMMEQLKLKKLSETLKRLANEFGLFSMLSGEAYRREIDPTAETEGPTGVQKQAKSRAATDNNRFARYLQEQDEPMDEASNFFSELRNKIVESTEEPQNSSNQPATNGFSKPGSTNPTKAVAQPAKHDIFADMARINRNGEDQKKVLKKVNR